jgi:hypothetical protein
MEHVSILTDMHLYFTELTESWHVIHDFADGGPGVPKV